MTKLPYNEIPTKVVNSPSKQEFNELVQAANEPFKVAGSIDNWELFKKISTFKDPLDKCDYLATLSSKKRVYFSILPADQGGVFGFNKNLDQNFSFKSKKAIFPQFMASVKNYISDPNLGTMYLQSTTIQDLNNKLGRLDLFKGFSPMSEPRFWIGTGNQFVSLHNDPYRNIIALFSGRKRVIMFPPEELPNLYPAPFDKKIGGVVASQVNVFKPDLTKFPLFVTALKKVKVAIINPGEFLYVPPLWWHAVEGEGFNIGINCWFYDDNEINNLGKLYIPAESLMLNINYNLISNDERNRLYNNFIKIIDADHIKVESTKKIDFQVVKEAKKIGHIINNSPLSDKQKDLWKNWVKVFAFNYIFCLNGDPFPTMHNDAFFNMIERLKNTKIRRVIQTIFRSGSIYIYRFLMKKKKRHGIVPL